MTFLSISIFVLLFILTKYIFICIIDLILLLIFKLLRECFEEKDKYIKKSIYKRFNNCILIDALILLLRFAKKLDAIQYLTNTII